MRCQQNTPQCSPQVGGAGGRGSVVAQNTCVVLYRHMPANLLAERKAVKQLAYHVLHIIQANMRLSYTSLVASLLLQHTIDDGILIGMMTHIVVKSKPCNENICLVCG